jgi:hypothetical protein
MFIMFRICFFFDPPTGLHLVLKFKITQVYPYGSQIMLLNSAKNFYFQSICPTSHANSYNERFMKQSSIALDVILYCMLGSHSNEPG